MKFNYENLDITNKAYFLIEEIYQITKLFPKNEEFGLTSQLRRSAISVVLNIAEGSGKFSKNDYARYARNSIGSLLETDACLKICLDQKYINKGAYSFLRTAIETLYFKLIAFEKSLIGKRIKLS